jgi:hypothetical protein
MKDKEYNIIEKVKKIDLKLTDFNFDAGIVI